MTIFFMGQRGVPVVSSRPALAREHRVQTVAALLASFGYKVTVACAPPFISRHLRSFGLVQLQHYTSFNPQKPGGFLHLLGCVYHIWRHAPDVVHLHGWRAAALVRLAALLSPFTAYVLTIDALPSRHPWVTRLIAWQARGALDAITTPTRTLQYLLLYTYHIRSLYLPDGYVPPAIPLIPPKYWGLRKGQYSLALVDDLSTARRFIRIYSQFTTRKPLVIASATLNPDSLKGYILRYPWLKAVNTISERSITSLIAQAHVVLAAGVPTPGWCLLQAMHAQRHLIATTHPFHEEIFGTTATFVSATDTAGLAQALGKVVKAPVKVGATDKNSPRSRAYRHFRWARLAREYSGLYHVLITGPVTYIPIDSVVPLTQKTTLLERV